MTGEDHTTEALIAALRSPALPSEQAGEAAAVAAMLDAMPAAATAQPTGRRSRRGLAIAAVTIASLGAGGLVAAGPGRFLLPAVDRSSNGDPGVVTITDGARPSAPPGRDGNVTTTVPSVTPAIVGSPVVEPESASSDAERDACPDGNHGDVVSEQARTSEPRDVRDVATSDCGTPDATGDTPAVTAPGRTGDTPAVTAPGRTGDTPANTAPGQTGDTPAPPGQTGDTPAPPGQTGDTPAPPGQTGDTPAPAEPPRAAGGGAVPPTPGGAPDSPGGDRRP